MHGNGVFTYENGRIYSGEYKEDEKNGFGIYRWPDGKIYEGQWSNG